MLMQDASEFSELLHQLGTSKLATCRTSMPEDAVAGLTSRLAPSVFAVRSSLDSTAAERCFLGSVRVVLMGSRQVVTAALWDLQSFMEMMGVAFARGCGKEQREGQSPIPRADPNFPSIPQRLFLYMREGRGPKNVNALVMCH